MMELLMNGNPVKAQRESRDGVIFLNLPLEKGWNHFEVNVPFESHDDAKMKIIFNSTSESFIKELRSSVVH